MTDPTDQLHSPLPSPDRIRAFFALVPEDAVRLQFLALARDVARRSRGRSISGEHVHLTLAFLGDVPLESVPTIRTIGDAMPRNGASLAFDTLGAWRASGAWTKRRARDGEGRGFSANGIRR